MSVKLRICDIKRCVRPFRKRQLINFTVVSSSRSPSASDRRAHTSDGNNWSRQAVVTMCRRLYQRTGR